MLPANYQYWRDQGSSWNDEYISRKKYLVYYHIQEILLADYFLHSAPARVLEFGCGVGRHLSYLKDIPGIEVYGFDQSASMVSNMQKWMDQEWIDEHVSIGEPVGRLPYPDGHFDIVFTSEVLIHVRPNDVLSILEELNRISKWQVIHLEPDKNYSIVSDEHFGCWNHDIPEMYQKMGLTCEVFQTGFSAQTFHRVILNRERPVHELHQVMTHLFRQLDQNLQPTIIGLQDDRKYLRKVTEELYAERANFLQQTADLQSLLSGKEIQIQEKEGQVKELEAEISRINAGLQAAWGNTSSLAHQVENLNNSLEVKLGKKILSLPGLRVFLETARLFFQKARISNPIARRRHALALEMAARPVSAGFVRVTATGRKNPGARGVEVWLLSARTETKQLDLRGLQRFGDWKIVPFKAGSSEPSLVGLGFGFVDIPEEYADELTFRKNPWSGCVQVSTASGCEDYDLYSGWEEKLTVQQVEKASAEADSPDTVTPAKQKSPLFSPAELEWIDTCKTRGHAVSINHPDWLGIKSSARSLFDLNMEIEDTLTETTAHHYAEMLSYGQSPAVVIQAFPLTYKYLVKALNQLSIPVYAIWHGGYIQSDEDYGWEGFQTLLRYLQEGKIKKLGFVKKGMEKVIERLGLPSAFVMNYLPDVPEGPSIPIPGGPHIGIWANFRKRPFAMMAAGKLMADSTIHVWNGNERVIDFGKALDLNAHVHMNGVPQDMMKSKLASMDLNLYVSLYECAPMLPLESLSVGVPCLFGPHSHYFNDHPYLYSRLVVPAPDRSDVIAEYASRALAERDQIITAYREYAPGYIALAQESVENFLK